MINYSAIKYIEHVKARAIKWLNLLKCLSRLRWGTDRGGLGSKGLCGIPYKKFFKIPKKPLFVTFCMGDYKSLAAIAALPQWPVRLWVPIKTYSSKFTKQ
jgi:hypothetical protein